MQSWEIAASAAVLLSAYASGITLSILTKEEVKGKNKLFLFLRNTFISLFIIWNFHIIGNYGETTIIFILTTLLMLAIEKFYKKINRNLIMGACPGLLLAQGNPYPGLCLLSIALVFEATRKTIPELSRKKKEALKKVFGSSKTLLVFLLASFLAGLFVPGAKSYQGSALGILLMVVKDNGNNKSKNGPKRKKTASKKTR